MQPKLLDVGSDKRYGGSGGGGEGGGGVDGGWSGEGVDEGCDASPPSDSADGGTVGVQAKSVGRDLGVAFRGREAGFHALEAPIDCAFVLDRTPWKNRKPRQRLTK